MLWQLLSLTCLIVEGAGQISVDDGLTNYSDESYDGGGLGRFPDHVRVVAIFGRAGTSSYDLAAAKLFPFAERGLLFNRTRLMVDILQLPDTDNMLEISGFLCAELRSASNMVGFLVGAVSQPAYAYILELARSWEVPVVDVFRDPALEIPTTGSFSILRQQSKADKAKPSRSRYISDPPMLLRIHPSYGHIAQAVQDIVTAYKWRRLVFLYDTKQNLMAMQSLLGDGTKTSTVREYYILQVSDGNLWDIVKIALNVQQWTTVVVAFDEEMTIKFLKTALRTGTLSNNFAFVLSNANMHMWSMEEFAQNWPNVTLLRTIVYTPLTRKWMNDARRFESFQNNHQVLVDEAIIGTGERIAIPSMLEYDREYPIYQTTALVIDGLLMFRQAIVNTLPDFFEWVDVQPALMLSCTKPYPLLSGYGSYLFNELRNTSVQGLTGPIYLNAKTGNREKVTFDVLGLSSKGLIKIGDWQSAFWDVAPTSPSTLEQTKRNSMFLWRPMTVDQDLFLRLKIPPDNVPMLQQALLAASIKRQTLVITTLLEKPYAMVRERSYSKSGDVAPSSRALNFHNLEGFCIDLIDEISAIVGFSYVIKVVGDGNYGKYVNQTGKWNGMIGELMEKKADVAAAPLTITYAREQVVDFTKPFLHLGISILHVQPTAAPPSLFSFMDPLASNVWAAILLASAAVAAVFFLVGRWSPMEFDYDDDGKLDEGKHHYTCGSSTWFVVGGFLGMGSEINPQAISTRIVTVAWWFFGLIIISSYTANLAAFLTVEQFVSPFENVEEMAKQTDVLYGTLRGGSTENFFREAKIDTYKRMWAFMKNKDVFATSNSEGIERVRTSGGKYAYLMESVSLQYVLTDNQQNKGCELRQVGGLIDSKGYGLATQRQSPIRDLLSMAILQLQENDKLHILYNKWWKSSEVECIGEASTGGGAKVLAVPNVIGIFVVLIAGFILSFFMVTIEILWNVRRKRSREKPRYCARLCSYLVDTGRYWCSAEKPMESRRRRTSRNIFVSSPPHLASISEEDDETGKFLDDRSSIEEQQPLENFLLQPPKEYIDSSDVNNSDYCGDVELADSTLSSRSTEEGATNDSLSAYDNNILSNSVHVQMSPSERDVIKIPSPPPQNLNVDETSS